MNNTTPKRGDTVLIPATVIYVDDRDSEHSLCVEQGGQRFWVSREESVSRDELFPLLEFLTVCYITCNLNLDLERNFKSLLQKLTSWKPQN